jgi:hypothetical protein
MTVSYTCEATTIVVKDEPTRGAILGALWEHIARADHKIDGFSDGLYDLLSDGFRPEATEADYRAARARFDELLDFLADAREDVAHVEVAELGTPVVLGAIASDVLTRELDSYRCWIEDTTKEFWGGDRALRQDLLDRHDAITALLAEFGEPAVA